MEKTKHHIDNYRGNQKIDFFDITSFKVYNNGESVVDVNTIAINPGETVKIIEEDGGYCDILLEANFHENGKQPKFIAIYKQFGETPCEDHLHPETPYAVTLHSYEQGDIVAFSQTISGYTILKRSFDGGITFLPENFIDLGYVEANQIVTYDRGGSLETNAIQFVIDNLDANSEIFVVGVVVEEPILSFAYLTRDPADYYFNPLNFTTNLDAVLKISVDFELGFDFVDATIVTAISGIPNTVFFEAVEFTNYDIHYLKFEDINTGKFTVLKWNNPLSIGNRTYDIVGANEE